MIRIVHSAYIALRQHGEREYPREGCGVLLGSFEGEVRGVRRAVACANASGESAESRYSIDTKEVIRIQREGRERGEEIVGFYHSHPNHPAQWSETDLAEAHWIGCSYVITSVQSGASAGSNSFELAGTGEEDKRFIAEGLEIVPE